jgi:hypothetical protein
MTQAEVRRLLGTPTWTGKGYGRKGWSAVPSWEYRINLPWAAVCYRVDFDYIGPGGSLVVLRTERFSPGWDWPSWCPWPVEIQGMRAQHGPMNANHRRQRTSRVRPVRNLRKLREAAAAER